MKENPKLTSPKSTVLMVVGFFVVLFIIILVGGFIFRKEEAKTDLKEEGKERMTFTDTKTGEQVEIAAGQILANFPKNFPIYPGAKLDSSMTGSKEDKIGGFWLNFTTDDSIKKVTDYYKSNLKPKGWEISDTAETPEASILTISGGKLEGSVNIGRSEEGKQTTIQIILEEKEQETSGSSEELEE